MGMNSMKFQFIMEINTKLNKSWKLKSRWLLQTDSNAKHTSKPTIGYLKRHKIKALIVPWSELHWKSVDKPQRNVLYNLAQKWKTFCKDKWMKMPQKVFTSCDLCQSWCHLVFTIQRAFLSGLLHLMFLYIKDTNTKKLFYIQMLF